MPIETAAGPDAPVVLMSEPDFAALINVDPGTIRRWRETGHGPRCVQVGKRFFYDPVDVQQWVDGKVAESQVAESQAQSR